MRPWRLCWSVISRRAAWAVVLCATLTMTVSYVDRTALAVLAPSVTKALHISETAYGWLSSAFSMAYLLATPLTGYWIDRVGARRGLVASALVWTSIAALHALVPGFGVLFALRIALGIAEGPSFPGSAQTVQRVLPAGERSRGFGVLFTGSSIGGMIVPPLASALYTAGGWRFAMLVSAVAGLVWVPLWIVATRRVAAQLDAREPVRPPQAAFRELISHPAMWRALCAIVAAGPIAALVQTWGAKYLDRTFSVKQGDVGHYLWLPPLVFDVAAVLFGDLATRQRRPQGVPPRALFAVGVVLAASFATLPLAATPWQAMAVFSAALAGAGIVYTLTTADMLGRLPSHLVAAGAGLMASGQSLSLIIANPLIGRSIDHFHSYDVAATVLGAWVVPGCLVWLVWVPKSDQGMSNTLSS